MFKKTRKIALMGGVLAAVSFGCTALAAAGAAPVPPTQAPVKAAKATAPPSADKETADGTVLSKGPCITFIVQPDAANGSPDTILGAQIPGTTQSDPWMGG